MPSILRALFLVFWIWGDPLYALRLASVIPRCAAVIASKFEAKTSAVLPDDWTSYLSSASAKFKVNDNSEQLQKEAKIYRGMMLRVKDLKTILKIGFLPSTNIKSEVCFAKQIKRAMKFALSPGEITLLSETEPYVHVVFQLSYTEIEKHKMKEEFSDEYKSNERIPASSIESVYMLNMQSLNFEEIKKNE